MRWPSRVQRLASDRQGWRIFVVMNDVFKAETLFIACYVSKWRIWHCLLTLSVSREFGHGLFSCYVFKVESLSLFVLIFSESGASGMWRHQGVLHKSRIQTSWYSQCVSTLPLFLCHYMLWACLLFNIFLGGRGKVCVCVCAHVCVRVCVCVCMGLFV